MYFVVEYQGFRVIVPLFVIGRGVYAASALNADDFVVQYYGELISAKIGNDREKRNPSSQRFFFSYGGKRLW